MQAVLSWMNRKVGCGNLSQIFCLKESPYHNTLLTSQRTISMEVSMDDVCSLHPVFFPYPEIVSRSINDIDEEDCIDDPITQAIMSNDRKMSITKEESPSPIFSLPSDESLHLDDLLFPMTDQVDTWPPRKHISPRIQGRVDQWESAIIKAEGGSAQETSAVESIGNRRFKVSKAIRSILSKRQKKAHMVESI